MEIARTIWPDSIMDQIPAHLIAEGNDAGTISTISKTAKNYTAAGVGAEATSKEKPAESSKAGRPYRPLY